MNHVFICQTCSQIVIFSWPALDDRSSPVFPGCGPSARKNIIRHIPAETFTRDCKSHEHRRQSLLGSCPPTFWGHPLPLLLALPVFCLQTDFCSISYRTLVGSECRYRYVILKLWQNSRFSQKSAVNFWGGASPRLPTRDFAPVPTGGTAPNPDPPLLPSHFKWPSTAYR